MLSDAIALQAIGNVQAAQRRALTTGEGWGLSTVEMAAIVAQEYAPVIEALSQYEHCRHACIGCFCTTEARAAIRKAKGEPEPAGGAR